MTCHKGHRLRYMGTIPSFCDCNPRLCRRLSKWDPKKKSFDDPLPVPEKFDPVLNIPRHALSIRKSIEEKKIAQIPPPPALPVPNLEVLYSKMPENSFKDEKGLLDKKETKASTYQPLKREKAYVYSPMLQSYQARASSSEVKWATNIMDGGTSRSSSRSSSTNASPRVILESPGETKKNKLFRMIRRQRKMRVGKLFIDKEKLDTVGRIVSNKHSVVEGTTKLKPIINLSRNSASLPIPTPPRFLEEQRARSDPQSFGANASPNIPLLDTKRREQPQAQPDSGQDWNRPFQSAFIQGDYLRMHRIFTDFVSSARMYGKIIAKEQHIADKDKTVKPLDSLGGLAGGRKYLVNGILFKLCGDPFLETNRWLYGGVEPSYEYAAKSAGHEIKGVNAYLSAFEASIIRSNRMDKSKLRVPFQVMLDYAGFRMTAMPYLRLQRQFQRPDNGYTSLVYGYDPKTGIVYDGVNAPGLRENLEHLAKTMHIAEHHVSGKKLLLAADIEIHHCDHRWYVLDLARAFPAECSMLCLHLPNFGAQPEFFRLMRPELLAKVAAAGISKPLSPDAFTGFTRDAPRHERKMLELRALKVTAHLLAEVIPKFARKLDTNERKGDEGSILKESVASVLHQQGINCRHIGLLRAFVKGVETRKTLFVEAVSRTLKGILRSKLRNARRTENHSEYSLRTVTVKFFNMVVNSADFWVTKVFTGIISRFGAIALLKQPNASCLASAMREAVMSISKGGSPKELPVVPPPKGVELWRESRPLLVRIVAYLVQSTRVQPTEAAMHDFREAMETSSRRIARLNTLNIVKPSRGIGSNNPQFVFHNVDFGESEVRVKAANIVDYARGRMLMVDARTQAEVAYSPHASNDEKKRMRMRSGRMMMLAYEAFQRVLRSSPNNFLAQRQSATALATAYEAKNEYRQADIALLKAAACMQGRERKECIDILVNLWRKRRDTLPFTCIWAGANSHIGLKKFFDLIKPEEKGNYMHINVTRRERILLDTDIDRTLRRCGCVEERAKNEYFDWIFKCSPKALLLAEAPKSITILKQRSRDQSEIRIKEGPSTCITMLVCGIVFANPLLVDMLLKCKKVNPNSAFGSYRLSPLHLTTYVRTFKHPTSCEEKNTELNKSLAVRQREIIASLVENGARFDFRDDLQRTPLHHFVYWLCKRIVIAKAQHRGDSKEKCEVSCKELKEMVKTLQWMLECAENQVINARDHKGNSIVHIAVLAGEEEKSERKRLAKNFHPNVSMVLQTLLEGKASLQSNIIRNTPLHLAAKAGNIELMKTIITYATPMDRARAIVTVNNTAQTWLELCAANSRKWALSEPTIFEDALSEAVEGLNGRGLSILCAMGTPENVKEESLTSALCFSVQHNSLEVAKWLIASKANLNSRHTTSFHRPLEEAIVCESINIVNLLIHHRALVNLPVHSSINNDKEYPSTLLHLALSPLTPPSSLLVKTIINSKASVRVRGGDLRLTPLHLAVRSQDIDIVRMLLNHNASLDVHERDVLGRLPGDMMDIENDDVKEVSASYHRWRGKYMQQLRDDIVKVLKEAEG